MEGIAGGVALLVGGGLFAALAALLSTRESRNKRYDDRRDVELDAAVKRREELEVENDKLRIETTRLRVLCTSHGIDPDSPARIV